MMYHATYVPDFYRALHALVHAEFRARKSTRVVLRARGRAPVDARAAATRAPAAHVGVSEREGAAAAAAPEPAGAPDRAGAADAAASRC